jgi:hypothetical protein
MRHIRIYIMFLVFLFSMIGVAWVTGQSFADASIKRELYLRRLPENRIYVKMVKLKGFAYAERYFEEGERFVALQKDLQLKIIKH